MGLLTQLSILHTIFWELYLLTQHWDRELGTPEYTEQIYVSTPRPNPASKLYTGHCHRYIKAPYGLAEEF